MAQRLGVYRHSKKHCPQKFDMVSATFDFDSEIFTSKVYRMATRSNMIRALLVDTQRDTDTIHASETESIWTLSGPRIQL